MLHTTLRILLYKMSCIRKKRLRLCALFSMTLNDQTDGSIKKWLVLFDRYRFFKQYRIVSGGTSQFQNSE